MLFSYVFQWVLYRILYHEKAGKLPVEGRSFNPRVKHQLTPALCFFSASSPSLLRRAREEVAPLATAAASSQDRPAALPKIDHSVVQQHPTKPLGNVGRDALDERGSLAWARSESPFSERIASKAMVLPRRLTLWSAGRKRTNSGGFHFPGEPRRRRPD
jgi:hypothetical protein